MELAKVEALFEKAFPNSGIHIISVGKQSAEIALPKASQILRPGNTIASTTMTTLADTVVYVAIVGEYGEEGLHFVTTSMNIHFLNTAEPGALLAKAQLIKTGQRLLTADVELFDHREILVAKATLTYMVVSNE